MDRESRMLRQDEAATVTRLEIEIVQLYAESGLIGQPHGYDEADLAELRRVRRLVDDLGLDHPAIEVVLRMRRRLLELQAEVRRLESELRGSRATASSVTWVDAEWTEASGL
jgi:hypothetical protein